MPSLNVSEILEAENAELKKHCEWLEKRERVLVANGLYSCAHCAQYSDIYSVWTGYCAAIEPFECCIRADFRDAAEFEARVAENLAFAVHYCGDCDCVGHCANDCEWERLKHARLAVEAEMEKEGKWL